MPPKTVAIIAPQFVPCSYPPAIRVRFFTNHLESFGWKPVVLCVEHAFMEEPADPEFTRLIPESLEILKVPALAGDRKCLPHTTGASRQAAEMRFNWDIEKQTFLNVVNRVLAQQDK